MKKGKLVDALLAGSSIRYTTQGQGPRWYHTLQQTDDGNYMYTYGPESGFGAFELSISTELLPKYLDRLDLRGWKIFDAGPR